MQPSPPSTVGTREPARKGPVRRLLPLIGLVALAWILSQQDGAAMSRALSGVSLTALMAAVASFTANLAIKSLRWHRLLAAQGHALPASITVPAFFAGQFYGQVTLGRLGEFYRAEALTARGVPAGRALSSCLFDRLLDLALVLCLSAGLSAWVLGDRSIAWVAALLGTGLVLAAATVLVLRPRAQRGAAPQTGMLGSIRGFLRDLLEGSAELLRPGVLLEASLWTCTAWSAYLAALWLLAASLGVGSGPVLLGAAACLAALSSLLPITVSGLGAREIIYAQMLGIEGVAPEVAIVLSLLHLAIMSASAIGFGLLGMAAQRRLP